MRHWSRGASLSDGVLVGLTPGGEVYGVACNFDLDLVHCGTVGEPGGGQDGGGDECEGEDDADDGVHFHGDFRLLSWIENGHKNSARLFRQDAFE